MLQSFGGKTQRKQTLGRTRCRWKNNIRTYIQEIGWRAGHKLDLAWHRDKQQAV